MVLTMERNLIVVCVVCLALFGYPLIAAISELLNVPNRLLSIGYRLVLLFLCFLILLGPRRPNRSGIASVAVGIFLVFWAFYYWRIANYITFHSESLAYPPLHYWQWSLGSCFIPALAIMFARKLPRIERLFLAIFSMAFLAAFLLVPQLQANLEVAGQLYTTGRLQLEKLNAITVGSLGGSVLLMGVWLFLAKLNSKNVLSAILSVVAVGVGSVLLIGSGSRGPLVAVLFSLTMFGLFSRESRSLVLFVTVFLLVGSMILGLLGGTRLFENINAMQRYSAVINGDDLAALSRLTSYRGAIEVFLEHPVLGFGLEEPITRFYSHNIILDAMMSAGVIGAILLIAFISLSLAMALRLLRRTEKFAWVSLLYFQALIESMFAGALYAHSIWLFSALLILATRISESERLSSEPCQSVNLSGVGGLMARSSMKET